LAAVPGAAASGVTWHVTPTKDATKPSGEATGVACLSATWCEAVGDSLNLQGGDAPLAEHWNGTAWTQQLVPPPPGAAAPNLSGVSCATATFCAAVGTSDSQNPNLTTAIAEIWNGSTWSPVSVPALNGTHVELKAVSCPVAGWCEATGIYVTAGRVLGFAVQWSAGAWRLQTTPAPAGTATQGLESVSCVSTSFCMAGDALSATTLEWNGSTWTAIPVPIPAGGSGPDVNSVSCPSANFCELIGTYILPATTDTARVLAAAWTGSGWKLQTVSLAPTVWKVFTGVSCTSASFCEAVGSTEVSVSGGETFRPVAEVWNGSAWTSQPVPSQGGDIPTSLFGVACTSSASCVAAGAAPGSHFPVTLESWNGVAWSPQLAVDPATIITNNLTGVSCVSATWCQAVGSATGNREYMISLLWNGTSWSSIVRTASPFIPAAVSCVSTSFCAAVGYSSGDAAAIWNGSSWQPQPTPEIDYQAVSCTSAESCIAVGGMSDAAWNGTSWAALPFLPEPVADTVYTGVSCVAANDCEAIGHSTTSGYAAHWDGTAWTVQAIPWPTGVRVARLTGISCTAAGSCEAIGLSTAGAFAASWDGTSWTAQALPTLIVNNVNTDYWPNAVSCTSGTACTMVGYAKPAQPLALAWDGSAWTFEASPVPAVAAVPAAISCAPGGPCMAVGYQVGPAGFHQTFAEEGS